MLSLSFLWLSLFQKYIELKRKENFIDYDDIIQLAIRFLSKMYYAEARHWKFKDLFVDEFQDVNPLQFALSPFRLGSSSSLTLSEIRAKQSIRGMVRTLGLNDLSSISRIRKQLY